MSELGLKPKLMGRIHGLDGLRAIAVLMVFLNHKFSVVTDIGVGGYGVRLFFILSGYLILGILYNQRIDIESGESTAKNAWKTFVLNRSFRIFPIYYVVVLFLLFQALMHAPGSDSVPYIAWFATYTSNFPIAHLTGQYPPSGSHLWSLSVEEQFYLLSAPMVLYLPSKYTKYLCWTILIVGVSASLSGIIMHNNRAVYVGSLSNFGFMGLGGLLALDFKTVRRLFSFPPVIYMACYLACPFAAYFLHRHANIAGSAIFFVSSIFGVLLLGSVVECQNSISTRILHLPPLRLLGRVSYSFYLFHPFVVFETWFPHLGYGWSVIVDLIVTCALSGVSWRLLESPILDFRHRFLRPETVVSLPAGG